MFLPQPYYYQPPETKPIVHIIQTDVCIYGGNSAGVIAALQCGKMGRKAVILEQSDHPGGMSSGGLSDTDIGNKAAIGGLSREFYRRCGKAYGEKEEWRFEPHVAEQIFKEMIEESGAKIYYRQFLQSVIRRSGRITEIRMESGLTVQAKMFIDVSYEGDLMAKAGVRYRVGRESNEQYNETLNGVQVHNTHQFDRAVDPYNIPGNPASKLLPGINPAPLAKTGSGDKRVQAYNFRLTLTTDPSNRIAFEKPEGYDPQEYILLARYLAADWPEDEVFKKFDPIRSGKTLNKVDKNNHGAVSTDFIGRNYDYPNGSYSTRERIFQEHVTYQKGLMWFLANDPSVPTPIRERWDRWGLCKDEFTDTGGWPFQLYVREARRMVSEYVMSEHNCRGVQVVTDPVGLAAYTMDSHNCERFVKDGRVWNEGDVQVGGMPPYPISYRAIVPRIEECRNLLVPVCLSATHIAYGSIRMEPVFMILGQSAATAACMALEKDIAVQELPYHQLKERLIKEEQLLSWPVEIAKNR